MTTNELMELVEFHNVGKIYEFRERIIKILEKRDEEIDTLKSQVRDLEEKISSLEGRFQT